MFNNQSKHEYYSKLLLNFAINKSELNAINRLIEMSNDIDNYDKHLQRDYISEKSVVYSVTNILKNVLRVVKFKNVRIKQF
jgi:predicted DNA-binding ArsR family transcriptional regulator